MVRILYPLHQDKYMDEGKLNVQVRLSCQRALLGNIIPEIRLITIGWNGLRLFKLRAYYDRQPTEEDIDDMNTVSGEVLSDIPFEHEETECIFNTMPRNELDILNVIVYAKKEVN